MLKASSRSVLINTSYKHPPCFPRDSQRCRELSGCSSCTWDTCDDPAATDPRSSYGTNVCKERKHRRRNLLFCFHTLEKLLREKRVHICFQFELLHKTTKNLSKHPFLFFISWNTFCNLERNNRRLQDKQKVIVVTTFFFPHDPWKIFPSYQEKQFVLSWTL